MTRTQKLQLKLSEARTKLGKMLDTENEQRAATWVADLDTVKSEMRSLETQLQAALMIEDDKTETETVTTETVTETREDKEKRELRNAVDFRNYLAAALGGHGVVTGPEAEYNQELGIPSDRFPLELLTRDDDDGDLETRAKINGDAGVNQGSWVDRLFADSAAKFLGVTFPSVAPGVAAYPVTTAGGTPAQRGRTEDAATGTYTVAVTELKPTRNSVHGLYSIEDDARLPGLASAIMRDMRSAMVAQIDKTIFVGDSGANEGTADIVGLSTAGISEKTLTQANKVKGDELVKAFVAYVDGVHATSLSDLRIVSTVGSNVLWAGTVHAAAIANQTVAQFLRASGISWTTKGDVEVNTAAGDFGAFIGLQRGIKGSGVAPVWSSARLVRDIFSKAKSGEVLLTLHYLWALGFPRTASFKRLKYVS